MYVSSLRKLCLIIVLNFLLSIGECRKPRIVGGQVAEKNYPFMVSLRRQKRHICGGSIINARTVVTAAHCVYELSARILSVHVGENTLQLIEGDVHNVERIHYHEMWSTRTLDYDVGLLRINGSFNFRETIQPIKLAGPTHTIPNSLATVLGWGFTDPSIPQLAASLREAQVPVLSQNDCRGLLGWLITDRMLCAGYLFGGVDACTVDSGGPLIVNDTLIGIVSWGIGCALPLRPGVYARVSVLRPWIENVLQSQYNEIL